MLVLALGHTGTALAFDCNLDGTGHPAIPTAADVAILADRVVGNTTTPACGQLTCDFRNDGKGPDVGDVAWLLSASQATGEPDPICVDGNTPAFCSTNDQCTDGNATTVDTCVNPGQGNSYCTNIHPLTGAYTSSATITASSHSGCGTVGATEGSPWQITVSNSAMTLVIDPGTTNAETYTGTVQESGVFTVSGQNTTPFLGCTVTSDATLTGTLDSGSKTGTATGSASVTTTGTSCGNFNLPASCTLQTSYEILPPN